MDVYSAIKSFIGNRSIERQNPLIPLWKKWYKGKDPSFHKYRVYNGSGKYIIAEKKSLGMGKIVCENWAALLMNEKTDVILPESDKSILDKIFTKTNFWTIGNAGNCL